MGQLFQSKTPIICGGWNAMVVWSECLSFENRTWKTIASMNASRQWSGYAAFSQGDDDILLVTGGNENNGGSLLNSVEFFDGQFWNAEKFSYLPESVHLHCLVKINNSMLFQIGGTTIHETSTEKTYLFDIDQNQWIPGPYLNQPRHFHSCGVMNWINPSTETEEKVVVVAGGQSPRKVELLYLNDLQTGWVFGPSLLGDLLISGSSMIEFQNSVILIGGDNEANSEDFDGKGLYQLSSPNGEWTKMRQNLKEKRMSHVAFLIPDELVDCQ